MNKQIFFWLYSIVAILFSCKSASTTPETDIETASVFIQAIWKLEFKNAEKLKEERLLTQSKKYEEIDRKGKVQKKKNLKKILRLENKENFEKDF